MSNFQVNKVGLDQVTLEMTTTGRSEGAINLREPLLDESLEYVFCVDHLNAPLDAVPINNVTDKELFRVIRRNAGKTLDDLANVELYADPNADDPVVRPDFVYRLDRKFFDIASFVRNLNNWARGVEQVITIAGLEDFREFGGDPDAEDAEASVEPPLRQLESRTLADIIGGAGRYDMIRFRLGVDGSLITVLSHDFVNNFVLQFTRYGAEVLGMGDKISAVVRRLQTVTEDDELQLGDPQTDYFLAVTTMVDGVKYDAASWLETTEDDGPNVIQSGNNTREIFIYSEHSLYLTMDHRVKISVSSHLPMLNNLLVKEQKETVDRMICEVFFENKVVSSVTFDENGVFTQQSLTNTLYAGMFPFVKKSDSSKQWHRLLTSYSLRFFRFSIFITYRNYDSTKDAWVFKTVKLPIEKTKYWDFSLRFLSLV